MKRIWTVWRFRSVDGKQVVYSARPSEPFEPEHEYQKIMAKGVEAWSAADALYLTRFCQETVTSG
jgi:hypothetical protein